MLRVVWRVVWEAVWNDTFLDPQAQTRAARTQPVVVFFYIGVSKNNKTTIYGFSIYIMPPI
jgi:hypothetical protein